MAFREYGGNVLKFPKDILREANYTINYTQISNGNALIEISWIPDEIFEISYDYGNDILESTFEDIKIKCDPITASVLTSEIVRRICIKYGFYYKWVHFFIGENPTTQEYFLELSDEALEKCNVLYDIVKEVVENRGINAEHMAMATAFGVSNEFRVFANFFLKAELLPDD